jgi:penicillin-binding protein 2
VANGGVQHKPHLVVGTQDNVTRELTPVSRPEPVKLGYKSEHIAVIKRAMLGVAQGGTSARVFAGAPYLSGGKTGTAQAVTIGQKDKYNASKMEEHQRDHSLYVAFAPVDDPQVALAVVVENAGFGAAHAAPIARRVFDYVLLGQYPSEEDLAAVQKGLAQAPIGKPREATMLDVRGRPLTPAGPDSTFAVAGPAQPGAFASPVFPLPAPLASAALQSGPGTSGASQQNWVPRR